jgi:hypothetical protein
MCSQLPLNVKDRTVILFAPTNTIPHQRNSYDAYINDNTPIHSKRPGDTGFRRRWQIRLREETKDIRYHQEREAGDINEQTSCAAESEVSGTEWLIPQAAECETGY